MERTLEHFSHEHPLQLINEVSKEKQLENLVCYGCQEPITTAAYCCEECDYYLHKKCGELPHGVIHPQHPQHPLTLLAHPPRNYYSWGCDVCKVRNWEWFTYHCDECKFDAHVWCTPLEERQSTESKFHEHPVTFNRRKATFFCDACGTQGEDYSYRCTDTLCEFWIHDTCASSEITVKRNDHHHPLQLVYSIPHWKRKFDYECYICKKAVHPNYWVYYCASCTYFAHLKCTASQEDPSMISDVESLDSDQVYLPVPGLTNMMNQFSIDTAFTDDDELILPCSNNHFSWIDDDDTNCNKKKKLLVCDVCVQPIISSSPFSKCGECCIIAHKRCTFLRREILHPSHDLLHPLTLYNASKGFAFVRCSICGGYTSGMYFRCETCDNFRIDVVCATTYLPNKIKHEAHIHSLALQVTLLSDIGHSQYCKSCNDTIFTGGMEYGCVSSTCNFHLHTNCAMLPGTLEHDWDKHLMSLTWPPFNHPEDYFCETCEEFIHPSHWLYHCSKCDQSFHTNCEHPHDDWSKVKFGFTYKMEGHIHNLTSVRERKKLHPCDHCGERYEFEPFLDCTSCNYHMCFNCGSKQTSERIEFPSED